MLVYMGWVPPVKGAGSKAPTSGRIERGLEEFVRDASLDNMTVDERRNKLGTMVANALQSASDDIVGFDTEGNPNDRAAIAQAREDIMNTKEGQRVSILLREQDAAANELSILSKELQFWDRLSYAHRHITGSTEESRAAVKEYNDRIEQLYKDRKLIQQARENTIAAFELNAARLNEGAFPTTNRVLTELGNQRREADTVRKRTRSEVTELIEGTDYDYTKAKLHFSMPARPRGKEAIAEKKKAKAAYDKMLVKINDLDFSDKVAVLIKSLVEQDKVIEAMTEPIAVASAAFRANPDPVTLRYTPVVSPAVATARRLHAQLVERTAALSAELSAELPTVFGVELKGDNQIREEVRAEESVLQDELANALQEVDVNVATISGINFLLTELERERFVAKRAMDIAVLESPAAVKARSLLLKKAEDKYKADLAAAKGKKAKAVVTAAWLERPEIKANYTDEQAALWLKGSPEAKARYESAAEELSSIELQESEAQRRRNIAERSREAKYRPLIVAAYKLSLEMFPALGSTTATPKSMLESLAKAGAKDYSVKILELSRSRQSITEGAAKVAETPFDTAMNPITAKQVQRADNQITILSNKISSMREVLVEYERSLSSDNVLSGPYAVATSKLRELASLRDDMLELKERSRDEVNRMVQAYAAHKANRALPIKDVVAKEESDKKSAEAAENRTRYASNKAFIDTLVRSIEEQRVAQELLNKASDDAAAARLDLNGLINSLVVGNAAQTPVTDLLDASVVSKRVRNNARITNDIPSALDRQANLKDYAAQIDARVSGVLQAELASSQANLDAALKVVEVAEANPTVEMGRAKAEATIAFEDARVRGLTDLMRSMNEGTLAKETTELISKAVAEVDKTSEAEAIAKESYDKSEASVVAKQDIARQNLSSKRGPKGNTSASPRGADVVIGAALTLRNTMEIEALGLTKGIDVALRNIIKTGRPELRAAAQVLLDNIEALRGVDVQITSTDTRIAGLAIGNTVLINVDSSNGRGIADVLVHELSELFMKEALNDPAVDAKVSAIRKLAFRKLQESGYDMAQFRYAFMNNVEFVSAALTDVRVQSMLQNSETPNGRSWFTRLINAVLKWLGLETHTSAFADVLSILDEGGNSLIFAGRGPIEREAQVRRASAQEDARNSAFLDAQYSKIMDGAHFGSLDEAVDNTAEPQTGERVNIADLKNSRGQIGNQGFTAESAVAIINYATGEDYSDTSLKVALDSVKASATQTKALRDFLEATPIKTSVLPDGTVHLDDGHHRGFLADQIGMTSLPTNRPDSVVVDEPVSENEQMIRDLIPESFTLKADSSLGGMMRIQGTEITYNPEAIDQVLSENLPQAATSIIETAVAHELAHASANATMTDGDYDALAVELGEDTLSQFADSYYRMTYPDKATRDEQIAQDRASGILSDRVIAGEWMRSKIEKAVRGASSEEILLAIKGNKTLLGKIVGYLKAFFKKLGLVQKDRFSLQVAANISRGSRYLEVLMNGGVAPADPAPQEDIGHGAELIGAIERGSSQAFFIMKLAKASKNDSANLSILGKIKKLARNMPADVNKILNELAGTNNESSVTMQRFAPHYKKNLEAAIKSGVAIEDVGLVLGTTEPLLTDDMVDKVVAATAVYRTSLPLSMAEETKVEMVETEKERLMEEQRKIMRKVFITKRDAAVLRVRALAPKFAEILETFRKEINDKQEAVGFGHSADIYLTRTYRFFNTKGWEEAARRGGVFKIGNEAVDFDALRESAAAAYESDVRAEYAKENKPLSATQLRDETFAKLDALLSWLSDNAAREVGDSIRIDRSRYMPKSNVNKDIRKLIGEDTNPLTNALRTFHYVAMLDANITATKAIRDSLLATGLAFEKETVGHTQVFGKGSSESMKYLSGLYVRDDIAKELTASFGSSATSLLSHTDTAMKQLSTTVARVSGAAVTAKTILSFGFYTRNILSNQVVLLASQGIIPFDPRCRVGQAYRLAWYANYESRGANATSEDISEMKKMVRLQILRDSSSRGNIEDLLRGFADSSGASLDTVLGSILSAAQEGNGATFSAIVDKIQQYAGKGIDIASSFNALFDDASKMQAFYYERSILADAYPEKTDVELDEMAATKVKATMPTHSQQLDIIKSFNRHPMAQLVFPFARWKSEVVRTLVNTWKLGFQEMRSGNSVMFMRGLRRVVSNSAVLYGGGVVAGMAMQAIFSALTGGDDEDERVIDDPAIVAALRIALPEWQRGHSVRMSVVNGELRTIDMTAIMPYAMLTDMVNIIKEGYVSGKGLDAAGVVSYIEQQIIGSQIAATAGAEVINNRDAYGRPIVEESDALHTKAFKKFAHFGKGALLPSVAGKVIAATRKGEQHKDYIIMGEVIGARPFVTPLDKVAAAGFYNLKGQFDSAKRARQVLSGGRYISDEDFVNAMTEAQGYEDKAQASMHKYIGGLRELGLSDRDITLRGASTGISKKRIAEAGAGVNTTWVGNPDWVDRTRVNVESAAEDDTQRRVKLMMDTAREMGPKVNVTGD
jgi:hypothetical protein